MLQTRSQKYAADVYDRVLTIQENPNEKLRGEFLSLARSFPVLVRTVGLVQALSFLAAKAKPEEGKIDQATAQGLLLTNLSQTVTGGDKLLEDCRNKSLHNYIRLTRDALDALLWYKRFSESLLNVKSAKAKAAKDTPDDTDAGGKA